MAARCWSWCAVAVLLSACSGATDRLPKVHPGKTTEAELRSLRGKPDRELPIQALRGSKLQVYAKTGESFQVEEGTVLTRSREPEAHERKLQHWRHLWKGKQKSDEALPGEDAHGHAARTRVLKNEEDRIAVYYESGSGEVHRVIEF